MPERLRITVSLADTAGGALLWSVKYDVAPKQIFSVQDDITRKVSDRERAAAAAKPPRIRVIGRSLA